MRLPRSLRSLAMTVCLFMFVRFFALEDSVFFKFQRHYEERSDEVISPENSQKLKVKN